MTNNMNYGGNIVKKLSTGLLGKEILGAGPYEYFIYETLQNETIIFDQLGSFSVYLLHKPNDSFVSVSSLDDHLECGDVIQVENSTVQITVKNASVRLLISGTKNPHPKINGIFITRHKDIYKVIKPWGHELWINGQHPCYALKQIFIKAGTKTSLQYHNFKQETNVLFQGSAYLHYKNLESIKNDEVSIEDISFVKVDPISSIDVLPKTLHRLEAITDILLFETSTPHLDDVVRVSDDNKRPDGRIAGEHLQ